MTTTPGIAGRLALQLAALVLLAATGAGCTDDFARYNEVAGFRLLAIAADGPELLPGDSATLTALIAADSDVTYQWSWCPFTTGADLGYTCAITRQELQALADATAGPNTVEIPPFELGTEPVASFTYTLPAEFLRALCLELQAGELPDFVEPPRCEHSFELTIRLQLTTGDETITGTKTLALRYDEASGAPNSNPAVAGASASVADSPEATLELPADSAPTLQRDTEYQLQLDIGADQAESYTELPVDGSDPTPVIEDLVITWFVQGGETDTQRTAFLDGEIPLERASTNSWTTPTAADFPDSELRLYFVIRDNRGGTSWLTRNISLEQ